MARPRDVVACTLSSHKPEMAMSRIVYLFAAASILVSSTSYGAIEFSEASSADDAVVTTTSSTKPLLRQYGVADQRELISQSFSGLNDTTGSRGFNLRRITRLANSSRSSSNGSSRGSSGGGGRRNGAVTAPGLPPLTGPVPNAAGAGNSGTNFDDCASSEGTDDGGAPASHAAPEPTALVIWGVLGLLGAVVWRRRS